ncbi:MAG: hypothetical protein HUK14_05980 [Muribaculaceae bacterium]|nr:hypothetical protein [Muribaculaceae bacterium]
MIELEGRILRPSGEFTTFGSDDAPQPHVYLTDDNGTYATEVALGKYDTPDRWRDATQAERDAYMAELEAQMNADDGVE